MDENLDTFDLMLAIFEKNHILDVLKMKLTYRDETMQEICTLKCYKLKAGDVIVQ